MKRILSMAVAFLLVAGSTLMAQPQHQGKPQKMTEEQLSQQVATRMAQRLELDADKTAKFVPIYVDYRKDLKKVWDNHVDCEDDRQLAFLYLHWDKIPFCEVQNTLCTS